MDKYIGQLIDTFAITDKLDPETGQVIETKEAIAEKLLQRILENTDKIKGNYKFQTGKEYTALLEGLADRQSKGVTYWDYIEVDTLLSLQKPKTNYPDEVIFITYHQICELFFKLTIQDLERIMDWYRNGEDKKFKVSYLDQENKPFSELRTWEESMSRCTRYFHKLIALFDVLKDGLSSVEFNCFRKSLFPASGFQTFQFRKIELMLTKVTNLTTDNSNAYDEIYWRKGAMQKTNPPQPAKVLENFNNKYDTVFKQFKDEYAKCNLLVLYENMQDDATKQVVEQLLKKLEQAILLWKIAHLNMIEQHMPEKATGTGGTKWRDYLPLLQEKPPKAFNKEHQVVYFPMFWNNLSDEQLNKQINDWKNNIGNSIKDQVEKIYNL